MKPTSTKSVLAIIMIASNALSMTSAADMNNPMYLADSTGIITGTTNLSPNDTLVCVVLPKKTVEAIAKEQKAKKEEAASKMIVNFLSEKMATKPTESTIDQKSELKDKDVNATKSATSVTQESITAPKDTKETIETKENKDTKESNVQQQPLPSNSTANTDLTNNNSSSSSTIATESKPVITEKPAILTNSSSNDSVTQASTNLTGPAPIVTDAQKEKEKVDNSSITNASVTDAQKDAAGNVVNTALSTDMNASANTTSSGASSSTGANNSNNVAPVITNSTAPATNVTDADKDKQKDNGVIDNNITPAPGTNITGLSSSNSTTNSTGDVVQAPTNLISSTSTLTGDKKDDKKDNGVIDNNITPAPGANTTDLNSPNNSTGLTSNTTSSVPVTSSTVSATNVTDPEKKEEKKTVDIATGTQKPENSVGNSSTVVITQDDNDKQKPTVVASGETQNASISSNTANSSSDSSTTTPLNSKLIVDTSLTDKGKDQNLSSSSSVGQTDSSINNSVATLGSSVSGGNTVKPDDSLNQTNNQNHSNSLTASTTTATTDTSTSLTPQSKSGNIFSPTPPPQAQNNVETSNTSKSTNNKDANLTIAADLAASLTSQSPKDVIKATDLLNEPNNSNNGDNTSTNSAINPIKNAVHAVSFLSSFGLKSKTDKESVTII